jgi:tricorn protease
VLRWEGVPSPDGKWIAHQDKDNQLWLLNVATKVNKRIRSLKSYSNSGPQFESVRWSPDSRWLTFTQEAPNTLSQIFLYNVETGVFTPITTDRYESHWASWSPDGKWIYFVSDRALKSTVTAPWGSRQPEPHFDRADKIYLLPLQKGLRSPFDPPDELNPDKKDDAPKPVVDASKTAETKSSETKAETRVEIELDGISTRVQEVPVPSGNYSDLAVAGKRICWLDHNTQEQQKTALQCLDIANKRDKPDTLMEGASGLEVSADGKILIRKQNDLLIVEATAKGAGLRDPKALADSQVDLKNWTFSVIPSDEFRESFLDAWRLHRDYFYDRNMHGVKWTEMRDKYGELVGRVHDRAELSDLISGMVSELSALHASVAGGDLRRGPDQIPLAALGALLVREREAGGYVVRHIYQSDPDRPDRKSPLAKPGVEVGEGDVLLAVNGRDMLSATDPAELLRNQANKHVLLRVRPKDKTEPREVVVKPITMQEDADLRYSEWEYTRRLIVERASAGKMGYVHLRAMGPNDINQWMEEYIPVLDREGLIVDARHNGGGNIDSWILDRLLRKAWMFWQSRGADRTGICDRLSEAIWWSCATKEPDRTARLLSRVSGAWDWEK